MAIVGGDSEDDVAALFTAADELAVDRATQGVSLEALLTGVGAARQIFLDLLVARARGEVEAGHLVDMLVRLDREAGRLQSRMILTHQATTASLARSTGAARLEALRSMVGTGDTTAAEQLGLDPGGRYHCIVADVSTPSQARAAQTRLATAHGTSGLVLGYLTRVSTRLPAADRVGDLVAVHTPALPVEALPAAHALCRQTLELIRGVAGAGGGLTAVTDHALLLALDSASLLGRLLAQERLGALSPQDSFHRQLAETGQTYLACGSRLAATAAALHVHPNTVAHRLRRLSELTSFPANERDLPLAGATAWWWAFTTWLAGS
jgi:hypothetical protein